ncbi:MAG: hypothetical protein RLY86_1635 [Pseudomonadota bacterium]|jgi:hypothetical protein
MVCHPRFYDGFQDIIAGRPFDYARADRLTVTDQMRYENGREIGAECLRIGLGIAWPRREAIPRPLKDFVLSRALRRAREEPRCDPWRTRPVS